MYDEPEGVSLWPQNIMSLSEYILSPALLYDASNIQLAYDYKSRFCIKINLTVVYEAIIMPSIILSNNKNRSVIKYKI